MQFKQFKAKLQENFKKLTQDTTHLFEVNLDKTLLWETYLNNFPEGTNEIYRKRREYDCSCCRHFIKNMGNVVVIKNNQVTTIWDFETNSSTFQPVVDALAAFVKSQVITDVWINKFNRIGTDKNFENLSNGEIKEWQHLTLELPIKFVNKSSRSEGDLQGEFRDTRNVFKRSLDEITEDSLLTVLELISSNSLYKGEEWKGALAEFLKYKKEYDKLQTENEKANYTWEQSVKVGGAIGRIKNHSMGTLLINISEGLDLNEAVGKFEFIVGDGYKRSKPIYSQKMQDDAKTTIVEMGYEDSLRRRYATLDDITVNNILFSNKDSAKRIGGMDIFEEMSKDIAVNPKKFSKVEEISIDNFISNALPTAKEISVLLENKHSNNMVSLIAPEVKDSKTMFKWDNNFSWAYSGNITDSSMKERVKSAGGKVDGVLRFSIQWNDIPGKYDGNDLDAHCYEPNNNLIYYSNKNNRDTTGQLDIDIQRPSTNEPAVENITWSDKNRMLEGTYRFLVHNYANRGGKTGFRAEIEFDGEIYSFDYNKELRDDLKVEVAEVTFNRNTGFTIKEKLPSNVSTKEIWNLKTNQFIPVSIVMLSPNHWNNQQVGLKHYFFMLKDCINSESPNGFYNEFLNQELYTHRKFMEALGSKLSVKDSDEQLSGLGFSSTKRNELIVKVKGQIERVLKIKI